VVFSSSKPGMVSPSITVAPLARRSASVFVIAVAMSVSPNVEAEPSDRSTPMRLPCRPVLVSPVV
jgi:hypothetical protein